MSIWQVAFGSAPLLRNQAMRDSDTFIEMANLQSMHQPKAVFIIIPPKGRTIEGEERTTPLPH